LFEAAKDYGVEVLLQSQPMKQAAALKRKVNVLPTTRRHGARD
jgi:hypothetical protein